jgi:glycine hydroxymethyltransferase
MSDLQHADPEMFDAIQREVERQNNGLELIASENFVSKAVLEAMGSPLTNKYAEGLPGKRYYGGCQFVDIAEDLARDRAKSSSAATGSTCSRIAGHRRMRRSILPFCSRATRFSGSIWPTVVISPMAARQLLGHPVQGEYYGVEREGSQAGRIDMDRVRDRALEVRPKMISIGASAYPRDFDYEAFRSIADEVGAFLWMDMAHTAGLIAARLLNDPMPHCHVVTTTTHKTLRGPRGGMILVGKDYEKPVRQGGAQERSGQDDVGAARLGRIPGHAGRPADARHSSQGCFLPRGTGAVIRDLSEAGHCQRPAMAKALVDRGYDLVSGGTDNHLVLVDLRNKGLTGKDAERRFRPPRSRSTRTWCPSIRESRSSRVEFGSERRR